MNPSALVAAITNARNAPAKILEVLREHGLSTAELIASAPPADPVLPYSRRAIAATPECEVLLARWAADRVCAPHDHGTSGGWVFFLQGRFHELSYRWDGRALVEGERAVREPGTHSEVHADEIHSCRTEGEGISLHVYFPRMRSMRVFDLAKRRTLYVADDCGAWVPADPTLTHKSISWPDSALLTAL